MHNLLSFSFKILECVNQSKSKCKKKNPIGESGTYLGMSMNIFFIKPHNIPTVFEDLKLKSGMNVQ